ncbi:MAG: hypothetical protein ACE5DO_04490, partial [Desulfobacterales bacterium]
MLTAGKTFWVWFKLLRAQALGRAAEPNRARPPLEFSPLSSMSITYLPTQALGLAGGAASSRRAKFFEFSSNCFAAPAPKRWHSDALHDEGDGLAAADAQT